MSVWNVAGELQRPKNITVGSQRPKGMVNAAFQRSSGQINMLLYPQCISILVKMRDPHRRMAHHLHI
jgi:hypothetical protein